MQKNLNNNIPRVLIRRIEDDNNNLFNTVPEIVTSNDENIRKKLNVSKTRRKSNMRVCLAEKQLDNENSQSSKNQFATKTLKENKSLYNVRSLGYNRYFNFSSEKLHDPEKEKNIF